MNNLKYFRDLAGATEKQIAQLIAATVYTYVAYEKERMIPDSNTYSIIAKLYGIAKESLICNKECISKEDIATVEAFAELDETLKNEKMIYNLCGNKGRKLGFVKISKIKHQFNNQN